MIDSVSITAKAAVQPGVGWNVRLMDSAALRTGVIQCGAEPSLVDFQQARNIVKIANSAFF